MKTMSARLLALAISLTLLAACLPPCALAQSEAKYVPGTYTATVDGNVGPLTVEVVFSENAIEQVSIPAHTETRVVSAPAIQQIPAAIVEHQSLAVDAVSSCTVTSRAILYGVRLCAEQAGGDLSALSAPLPQRQTAPRQMQADVVVVGGGLSGLVAAASAADSGKRVILFEKTGACGGSSALSGGVFVAVGVEGQAELGTTTTVDEFVQLWMDTDEQKSIRPYDAQVDYRATRTRLLSNSAAAVEFLNTHGDPLNPTPLAHKSWFNMPVHYYSADRVDQADTYDAGGAAHIAALAAYLGGLDNVSVYCNSPVTQLLCADGAMEGVVAESPEGTVTVSADKVILACGGYARNGALLERFTGGLESADFAPYACSAVGNTGDGILMAEAIGADVYEEGFTVTMGFPLNAGYIKSALNGVKGLLVMDASGKRIASYNADKPLFITSFSQAYKDTGAVYELHDAASSTAATLEANLSSPAVFKADTLEELAKLTGMDAQTLLDTVKQYNACCDAGEDPAFGQTTLQKIEAAPFYATSHKLSNYATFGGLRTNENYEVLSTQGNVIAGLYAVGELNTADVTNQFYLGGSMLLNAIVSGMLAGQHAAK